MANRDEKKYRHEQFGEEHEASLTDWSYQGARPKTSRVGHSSVQFVPPFSKAETVGDKQWMQGEGCPATFEAVFPDDHFIPTIFPEAEEIETESGTELFLKNNMTKGPYRDWRHYINFQARLFREDYVEPIRNGIKEYKQSIQKGCNIKSDNFWFYADVHVITLGYKSDQGITHFLSFDITPFNDIDWSISRRLMFGSLLCLSKDHFQTTIFATVAERNPEELKKGIVQVVFQNHLEDVFASCENDTFVMGETTAYFETYKHVLEGLLEMRQFPLERYIIFCEKDIKPPEYVDLETQYTMSCIVDTSMKTPIVPILDNAQWPHTEDTMLNHTQLDALKAAITQELAIIQGPPGTGKTVVGLKILELLMENKVGGQLDGTRKPILVVCYTNHALDQFLKGTLEFCPEGIIRVGGQSSSEELQQFNLRVLRQRKRKPVKELQVCRRKVRNISKTIDGLWQESLRVDTMILTETDLRSEMGEAHFLSLSRRQSGMQTHIISVWLHASNANMDNHLKKAATFHLEKLIANNKSSLVDTVLLEQRIVANIDFLHRVKIYSGWVFKYRNILEYERDLLKIKLNSSQSNQVTKSLTHVETELEKSTSYILDDEVLIPFMTSIEVYQSVQKCVKNQAMKFKSEDKYLKNWLFEYFSSTDQLLDAIDQMSAIENKYDSKKKVDPRPQWVVTCSSDDSSSDDSDCSDETSEDSQLDESAQRESTASASFKEIKQTFKLFESKEILLLQRARLLGIDLSERPDDSTEEWTSVSYKSYSNIFSQLNRAEPLTEEEASTISDLWSLDLKKRYRLYKYWISCKKEKLNSSLIKLTAEYNLILDQKREIQARVDIDILKTASVIGMTTTGAAKHRKIMQEVGCSVIIVEEAAEVLEAHIVTTLNKKCQHLILIGDHQQLRPNTTVHRLAVEFDLNISMFERLVCNKIANVVLLEQHRMRPEISVYLRHLYPGLKDHYSVSCYDQIKGVSSNVFFLNHSYEESSVTDSRSKANVHEAQFIIALCKYFLQQGYLGWEITILAAYGGQVNEIKERMELEEDESRFKNVRVTTIDNFQGRENNIILLSLVRSNRDGYVGFLKTNNRVCVALSRAKEGLFVIGNFDQLALQSPLWRKIIATAKFKHAFGHGMKLVCHNHGHESIVSESEDFVRQVPLGGCYRKCDYILSCGHACVQLCHAGDQSHEDILCKSPCSNLCPEGHLCPKKCHEFCGECEQLVVKTLPCGHQDMVMCHLAVEQATCGQMCALTLKCGHKCKGSCGRCSMNDSHMPCQEKIDQTWPCGHSNNVNCCTDPSIDLCPTKCREKLMCGHKCSGTCGECLEGRVHKGCTALCRQPLPCGHPCKGLCGALCQPCQLRCLNACRHQECQKECGEQCNTCYENCAMGCTHQHCDKLCRDDCTFPAVCDTMCKKQVTSCKHRCVSLCGEECVCYKCEIKGFSLIDFSSRSKPKQSATHDHKEKSKNFTPTPETLFMKIPYCGHIFTIKQLDRYVKSFEPSSASFIRCPKCEKTTIHRCRRYNSINRERTERRENLKFHLSNNQTVPECKLLSLRKSQNFIPSIYCGDNVFLEGDKLKSNHAEALTMKFRFAFVLEKIIQLHAEYGQLHKFSWAKWKAAIQAIQENVSDQQRKELTLEMHHLLMVQQAIILGTILKEVGVNIPDDLKKKLKRLVKTDCPDKLTMEGKVTFNMLISQLTGTCTNSQALPYQYKEDVTKVMKTALLVAKVLDQPSSQDLCTILDCEDKLKDETPQESKELAEEGESEVNSMLEVD